jgi:hypothetical protein
VSFLFMRMTFSNLADQFARNIGKNTWGELDGTTKADFNSNLGQRYQFIFSKLSNYQNAITQTSVTVATQQYYHNPMGFISPDSCYITIGSFKYPLIVIFSQHRWDLLNATPVQASAVPRYIFPRVNDFGIYPIPQAAYTITFAFYRRERNLSIEDYSEGTVTVTNDSTTIAGSGTTFTPAMVGRYFSINDPTSDGQGYWYKIATYNSAGSIDLESSFGGTTGSSLTYIIGESPELPEEAHVLLCDGATADYYSGARSDPTKATWWNNKFWTGDGNNSARDSNSKNMIGGLLGMKKSYDDRATVHFTQRKPKLDPLEFKAFSMTITNP